MGHEGNPCVLVPDISIELLPPSTAFKYDMTKDGWECLEPGPPRSSDPVILTPSTFLAEGETCVGGKEMRCRAMESVATLGLLAGQHQAEQLHEQRDNIPTEFRDYRLIFPGTLWRATDGRHCVPTLTLSSAGNWEFALSYLNTIWGGCERVVRLHLANTENGGAEATTVNADLVGVGITGGIDYEA